MALSQDLQESCVMIQMKKIKLPYPLDTSSISIPTFSSLFTPSTPSETLTTTETEERFRILTEILPVGICQLDLNGKALFTNESWVTITGLSASQMKNKSWLKKFVTSDNNDSLAEWLERAEQHKKSNNEYQIEVSPGRFRWVKGTTIGLFTKSNTLKGFLITITDISDQKLVLEELSIYKDRLDQAQKAGNIGIFDWNIKSDTIFWSSEQEKLYGLKPGTFTGKTEQVRSLIHPDDSVRVQAEIQIALKKKEDYSSQFRVIYPDKSTHWLMTKAKFYLDKKQQPQRMVGITIDISDEKQTEVYRQFFADANKVLSFSLDYQTTLNNISTIAVPTFGDWCAIDMLHTDGSIRLVALTHKDPKKVSVVKKFREDNPTTVKNNEGVALAIKTGKSQFYPTISMEFIKKSLKDPKALALVNKIGIKSVMIVPLFSSEKPIGAISFVMSESHRQYNQDDLNMAEELAKRASLAIDNARLFQSEQRAVAAREEFLSIASHELKTPITIIKAFNQILKQKLYGRIEVDTFKMLERSENQIERLIKLISDLLDATKIQAGKLVFNEELFNMQDLVTEITNDFLLMRKSHVITIKGSSKHQVKGDKERIGQVINNLISNAFKYSPEEKKIIITIKETHQHVTVAVQDFGIGVDKAHVPRVFERFFRASKIEAGTLSSLGLGLYISAEIIHRHQGEIWVESQKGKGSTFFFQLPLTT